MAWAAVIVGGASLAYGAYKDIHGASQAKKAQRNIEGLNTPGYTPNQAINSYYQSALNRYNTSPYNSAMYQVSKENADKSLAAGIGALQDRRSAVGGIGGLMAIHNNSLQKAGVQAEQFRNQEFSQLGKSAQMKAMDDRTAYQYNQLMPYQKKLSLYQAQGIGGVNLQNSGLQDINSGVNDIGMGLSNYYKDRPPKTSAMQDSGGNQYGTGMGPQTF